MTTKKKKILNPFIYFRDDDVADESDIEDEEETVVFKSIVKEDSNIKGLLRLSSGAVEYADLYVDNEGSYVLANKNILIMHHSAEN